MSRTLVAMRERPKTTIILAVLLIVASLTLSLAREAIAYTFDTGYDFRACCFPRDTDGHVPESTGGLNGGGAPSTRTYHVYGYTTYWIGAAGYMVPAIVSDSIKYDWRETDYCHVGHLKVINHEHAHSRGWGHGKGTPDTNDAYYAHTTCWP